MIPTGLIQGSITTSNSSVVPSPKIHTLKGEMYIVDYVVPYNLAVSTYQIDDDAIKLKLAQDLAKELLQSKAIEFTKENDIHADRIVYRARIFAVPDTMVRVIRENF